MVLGLLVAVSAFLVTIWGFPTSYTYPPSGGLIQGTFFMPGPQFFLLSFLSFLMGIVALGCGIAQFRLVRLSRVSATSNQPIS